MAPLIMYCRIAIGILRRRDSDLHVAYFFCTDQSDSNLIFSATITMVDGAPVVEWSPKLSVAEEAKRKYTIYGMASLESGEDWHSPTNALDRFFTVGVEMK